MIFYDTPNIARKALLNGKWMLKPDIRHIWIRTAGPEFFTRAIARAALRGGKTWKSLEAYQAWSFSREMRDMTRRGHIERKWIGKPNRPDSMYKVRLTSKGRAYYLKSNETTL